MSLSVLNNIFQKTDSNPEGYIGSCAICVSKHRYCPLPNLAIHR